MAKSDDWKNVGPGEWFHPITLECKFDSGGPIHLRAFGSVEGGLELTSSQARDLADALLRFADQAG